MSLACDGWPCRLSLSSDQYVPSPADPAHRFELIWRTDGILEQLHNILPNLDNYMSNLVGAKVKYNQARMWQDLPGYMIPFHEDDQVSAAHIQIYISGSTRDIGTTWYTTRGRTILPFVPNTGYITVCSQRYPHGMLLPVRDQTRYSLYITFAKAN